MSKAIIGEAVSLFVIKVAALIIPQSWYNLFFRM